MGKIALAPFDKHFSKLLICLVVLSLFTKLVRITYPSHFYFDEVYFGYSAKVLSEGRVDSYYPTSPSPPGVANEWTHPPLGKLLMAANICIFGDNAIGWRIGSVLFGTALIPLLAFVALELFRSKFVAIVAAFFATFEGLLFVQSRIGMIDMYLCSFMLLCLYFYLKWKQTFDKRFLVSSSLFFGLGLATKWSMLFILPLLFFDLLFSKISLPKKNVWSNFFLCMILIPAFIYLLSHVPLFLQPNGVKDFLYLQIAMLHYHATLEATHPHSSTPFQWIFDLRPVWMMSDRSFHGLLASIYNLGNPIVFYGGLVAIVWMIGRVFLYKTLQRSEYFCILWYLCMWVPWLFSPRILLFYHYTPAVPALCIALAHGLETFMKPDSYWRLILVSFILFMTTFWFLLFYPQLTGLPVPIGFAEKVYFFIPSWR